MSQFRSHVINTKLTKHFMANVSIRHYKNNRLAVKPSSRTENSVVFPVPVLVKKGKQWQTNHKHHAFGLSSKWVSYFSMVPEQFLFIASYAWLQVHAFAQWFCKVTRHHPCSSHSMPLSLLQSGWLHSIVKISSNPILHFKLMPKLNPALIIKPHAI